MAITFTEITLQGVTQTALVLKEDIVILRNGLDKWDLNIFNEIDKLVEGVTTLFDAFGLYKMLSGHTAYQYYSNHLINLTTANASEYINPNNPHKIVAEVKTLKTKVKALETAAVVPPVI